ncbi:MAG TPA: signal recognition particle-docking protein FtsY, partial [Alphaproteobacteria bacterium]|jgi:fused signal recognition particle receptor|nr:signal recognition particle-docking protein FtsY [Alphaproteobacteria bacterium]
MWFFKKKKTEQPKDEAVEVLQADVTAEVTAAAVVQEAEPLPIEIVTQVPAAAEAVPQAETPPAETPATETQESWFKRLTSGLSKSSNKITEGLASIITKRKLDDETLQELEELLISADLGPATSAKLATAIGKNRFGKEVTAEEIRAALAEEIEKILQPVEKPLFTSDEKPFVILMVGVNGTGKTTTIGKLGQQFTREGRKVMLAAGDTFRAAAVGQLKIWGDRIGCPVVTKEEGADSAALAYEAIDKAMAEGADILMIDTAGRLQNKANLMEELSKIVRVIGKKNPAAPHATLLVLDATVGQNAHSQLELFSQMIDITGLVVTKLDGTAKGGVLVSLAERFALPVHAIGIGEGIDDLRPFSAADYAKAIVGLEAQTVARRGNSTS